MNIGKIRQFHAALAGGFGSLVMGALNVWPSYTSPLYYSNTTTPLSHPMTLGEGSLLGSLPSLGAMIGTAMVGTVIDRLGRRNGGVLMSLPFIISWAVIGVTSSINLILAMRLLGGIAGGFYLALAPIITAEVAEDSIRGALASSSIYLYVMGALISNFLGMNLSYMTNIWANVVISVICTFLILLMVESPVYLIRQNKDEEAKQALAKYRGLSVSSKIVIDEFSRLKQQLSPAFELVPVGDLETARAEDAEKEMLNTATFAAKKPQPTSAIKLLISSPTTRSAFLIVLTVITLQVYMGMVPVQVYSSTIFQEMDGSKVELYACIFFIVQLCGGLSTALLADRLGRRILIIVSSVCVCICMLVMGYLLQRGTGPAWLILVFIYLYCFNFTYGAGCVPYILMAEVFVPEVQTLTSMILVESVWFMNFVTVAIFPFLNKAIGIYGSFYIFGVIALGNAIFSFIFVPETKGLSNEQIQEKFRRK